MFAIDLNHPDVQAIQKHAKLVHFKKGQIILRPDNDTTYLHIVLSGMVKVYSISGQGEENISSIYGADNIFPLGWIIEHQRLPNFFAAMTDCEIALLPQDIFLKYMNGSIDISNAILKKVIEQFIMFGTRIVNLEFKYARERLAYRLLTLSTKFGERKGKTLILPHFNQKDLGATINVSREVVSREIARLERLGVIEYKPTGIIIKDVDKLQQEIGKDTIVPFMNNRGW